MATKKRAKKRSTARRRSTKSKPAKKSFLRRVCLWLVLIIGVLAATYYFGPFKLRTQMERIAMQSIQLIRAPEFMPRPIVRVLNFAYDTIPESQGLVVESGELGYDDSPFIAGMPQSQPPVRVLSNTSYTTLFDETRRQPRCIAFKIDTQQQSDAATIPENFFEDTRIKTLRAKDLSLGQWSAQPLAPPLALSNVFGQVGANEASLTTNLAPMNAALASGLWPRLITEISETYPQRFGTVWIYIGPVTAADSPKLDAGISIPNAFYAIVFDLTDTGGLRAIAFLVPQDTKDTTLSDTITSIAKIEQLTGLNFLPEVDYHAREVLKTAVSPQLW